MITATETPTRLAIAGAAGRMGRALIEACLVLPGVVLAAAFDKADANCLGKDAGELVGAGPCGVAVGSDTYQSITQAQVLIDFTTPAATLHHLQICRDTGVRHVIGTTGFDAAAKLEIAGGARDCGIVFAPNMSVGVNVLFRLIDVAAKVLNEGYDVEIVEAHHRHKVDAPSGTALRMGEIIAAALHRDLKNSAVYGREGNTGPRTGETIGFATIRAGDIVGDHTALFAGIGERIEISHRATSRAVFAQGALRAARWVMQQPPGLYDMQDVLGL